MKQFSLFSVLAIILSAVACSDPINQTKNEKSVQKDKSVDTSTTTYTLKKKDYIIFFNTQWKNIQLVKEDGLPQYELYHSQLDSVIEEILLVSNIDSAASQALKQLRLKFLNSNKFKKATHDFLTYGQPGYDGELFAPCETAFDQILKDPSSLDIIDKRVTGQSKNGWIVVIRYRAKNSFGAKVLQQTAFEVRYSFTDKAYFVANFY